MQYLHFYVPRTLNNQLCVHFGWALHWTAKWAVPKAKKKSRQNSFFQLCQTTSFIRYVKEFQKKKKKRKKKEIRAKFMLCVEKEEEKVLLKRKPHQQVIRQSLNRFYVVRVEKEAMIIQ